tara:strand:+ start:467 stop:1891 length:1425 start_codon:yes stop_codon:yes gene_type:complete
MENGKTDAMAPKKNAAPAEAPKSLGATIQNVITKAVTSPTDGKIDFAQGVNHITGDPQQKSAKPAEPMQSLKAGYDMKPKSETYEDKEEVKEADEKEDEKMMKAQADIKKMNASVHKKDDMKEAEDKKSEMIKAEIEKMKKEMADKKDELKAQVDKEKEMNEGEMPKAALDALKKSQEKKDDKEDVKEASHDDEKKKEIKAQKDDEKEVKEEKEDEKKEIKASAKDKVKDMDMKEDVAALTDGEELSEEFKAKAATIFESAVKAKLVEEIEKLEGEYETKVAEKVEETKEEIVEKVDAYLNYVVESWMKDNELAIEKGLKSEITEDFIGGMKKLFETHYIDLPDSKFDVVEDQAAQIVKLKEEMNKTLEANVELNQKIGEFARDEIINDVSSDLAETETEKLKGLAESIEYVDAADYRTKVETIKNSYFPKSKASDTESNEVAATENMTSDVDLSESMAAYTAAISKNQAKKLY